MTNISLLSLRVIKEKGGRYDVKKKITEPRDAHRIGIEVLEMHERTEEIFAILTLDTKNKITGVFKVSTGSLSASIVHPREVFKRALLQNASAIILLHNHPSGDPKPSTEDIDITKRLIEAGEILGIKILDHIIIGDETRYISLKESEII